MVNGEYYATSQDVFLNFDQVVADYRVLLQVENEFACVDSVSKVFRVEPTFAVYVPNVFTPDGDGINDQFVVRGEGVQNIEILIRDRWGKLLAEHSDLNTPVNIPLESANHMLYYELFITDKDGIYHYRDGIINVIK